MMGILFIESLLVMQPNQLAMRNYGRQLAPRIRKLVVDAHGFRPTVDSQVRITPRHGVSTRLVHQGKRVSAPRRSIRVMENGRVERIVHRDRGDRIRRAERIPHQTQIMAPQGCEKLAQRDAVVA